MSCELRCRCGKRTMVFQFLTEADGPYTDECCENAPIIVPEPLEALGAVVEDASTKNAEELTSKRGRRPKVK